jgi:hypothetical protein
MSIQKIYGLQKLSLGHGKVALLWPAIQGMTIYEIGIETDPGHFAILDKVHNPTEKSCTHILPANTQFNRGFCVRAVGSGDERGDWSDLIYVADPDFAEHETPCKKKDISRTELAHKCCGFWGVVVGILLAILLIAVLALGFIATKKAWHKHHQQHEESAEQQLPPADPVPAAAIVSEKETSVNTTPVVATVEDLSKFKIATDRIVFLPPNGYHAGDKIPESLVPGEQVTFQIAPGWDLFPSVDNPTNVIADYNGYNLPRTEGVSVPVVKGVERFRIQSTRSDKTVGLSLVLKPSGSCSLIK